MYLGCITLGSCSFVLELQWVSFSLSWWIRAWFLSLFTRPTPCWDPAASTGALFRTWWSNILSLCKGFINQNLYWLFHSLLIGTLERAAWVLACVLATVISSKTKREFLQDKEQLTHCSSRTNAHEPKAQNWECSNHEYREHDLNHNALISVELMALSMNSGT